MTSLYHHEIISHEYADDEIFPKERLQAIGLELLQLLEGNELTGQRQLINVLLGAFIF